MSILNVKKLSDTAKLPFRASADAAGYDLFADEGCVIKPHNNRKIKTNISMEIPKGHFGAIYARSGLATKESLRPANSVGIIDADYRGNVIVALHNDSNEQRKIRAGDRVAQLVIQPHLVFNICEVDDLDNTERGDGGFSSTGR